MKSKSGKALSGLALLKGGVSVVALTALAATLMTPVYAQDAAPADDSTADAQQVVVVGVRRSLKTAQQIKRDSDTVVDSITATDIGAFPDKSVAEALQRVAGITVSRMASPTDTAHFSAEPSGVLVRGLNQVRSEFNGRDVFSANSSRGLSWGDISPELMAGVDTYKNQTAELIEGGIAGSINLRTRVPFDSKGQLIAFSADMSYGDMAKEWTPDFSGIYSNRWATEYGEFGLMFNAAYSKTATQSQGTQFGRMGIFCTDRDDPAALDTCSENQFGVDGTDSTHNFAYIPVSTAYHDTRYDRARNGVAFAAQWQNNDHSMLATLQYNRSEYENKWHEHVVTTSYFDVWAQPLGYQFSNTTAAAPLSGQSFTFDNNGVFQSGVLTGNHGWFGASDTASEAAVLGWGGSADQVAVNSSGQNMFNSCQAGAAFQCTSSRQGAGVGTTTRYSTNTEVTEDLSANFKWDVNDHIKTNFDVQYVKASITNYDINVDMNSYANVGLDMSGEFPVTTFMAPTNVNQSPGGLTNANNYYYNSVMDHTEDSEGTEFAARFDVQYSWDDGGWLDSLKAGVRFASREQKVNWSNYNWKNISNTYSNNAATWNVDSPGHIAGLYHTDTFGTDLMRRSDLLSENTFLFFNYDVMEDRAAMRDAMSIRGTTNADHPTGIGSWNPICERPEEAANSCYSPAEMMDIKEDTSAAYVMLKYGGGDKTLFGFPVSGNVGVRYVHTTDTSTGGGVKYPAAFEYNQNNCDSTTLTPVQLEQAAALGLYPVTTNCVTHHSVDDVKFRDGLITSDPLFPAVVEANHDNWLPSFNLKLNLSDKWLVRFAASRAMSRPDMGYLRNYFFIQGSALTTQELYIGNPDIVLGDGNTSTDTSSEAYKTACAVGTACSYNGFRYTASSGNPRLKPTTADQFDLTVENYFASVGSFTFNIFYKQFHDYIQNGTRQTITLTHNGITRDIEVTGPVNGEGASIKGYEVAYQRFFDFLPSPFDGLGIQANYTHIQNTGIKNTGINSTSAGGGGGLGAGGGGVIAAYDNITVDRLEGLSDEAYNLTLMYEKGPWALRTAYSYRSKFLVTAADCCVGFPIWQKGNGYLDGSIRYRVNDNIEVSIQGSNLSDTKTVLLQQVDNRGTLLPNATFMNDRRVQLGVRLKY